MNEFDAPVRQDGEMATVDLAGVIDGGADAALDPAPARCDELGAHGRDGLHKGRLHQQHRHRALGLAAGQGARRDGRPVVAWGLTDHYRGDLRDPRLADFLEVVADEAAARAVAGVTPDEE